MNKLYDDCSYEDVANSYDGFHAFIEWLLKKRLNDNFKRDVLSNYSLPLKQYRILAEDILEEIKYAKEWALYSYKENESKYADEPYSTSDFIRGVIESGPDSGGWGGFDITHDDSNIFRLWGVMDEVDVNNVSAFKDLIQDLLTQFDPKTIIDLGYSFKENLYEEMRRSIDKRLQEYNSELQKKGEISL